MLLNHLHAKFQISRPNTIKVMMLWRIYRQAFHKHSALPLLGRNPKISEMGCVISFLFLHLGQRKKTTILTKFNKPWAIYNKKNY